MSYMIQLNYLVGFQGDLCRVKFVLQHVREVTSETVAI